MISFDICCSSFGVPSLAASPNGLTLSSCNWHWRISRPHLPTEMRKSRSRTAPPTNQRIIVRSDAATAVRCRRIFLMFI